MHISQHAVRRYKQRFGNRSTSKERVKKAIKNALKHEVICVIPSPTLGKHYICKDFVVVVEGNKVVTVHDGSALPKHVRDRMSTTA